MNEFVDMHVHSKFSIDGMSTMEDYCLIAGKTGTRVICFTEHVDFNSAEKNLSIVKRIVDIHQGELTIQNREQGGLEAIITLPLQPEHVEEKNSLGTLEKIKQSLSEHF